ncbi:BREX-1 system adenine-specific DNA-methyltransferase PglX [Gordonia sp. PP30]|uniref:BREX-1 system adenine-specific DNA-methyltransferase PglX n=1 Tax=Gordonia sp. PP30 TaxID=2935861 RepID=UPI001FFE684B|nr:BREX-1 system adenine-specific DNA-methyltransferase PglX [Gordonia sp. PP30]UQE73437.1 BREX-1 system adenine-specific DNA-methyltransferase PglX [Gordonia sp. PP30]
MTTSTTAVLNSGQRNFLDGQTQRARAAAQRAAEGALRVLSVGEPSRPGHLSDEQNTLRLALRDKARQLGDATSRAGAPLTNLVHDVAYEQWHRLLFARFLEVNGLLRHPEYCDVPLSLEDCGDFASDLGERDEWAVAARFASEILPGVFRLTDPAVQVRFATEHRAALERLLMEIPAEVFTTEDALGWVYQFWQTAEKKRVNESGVKIGGADLSPVTQLFTENYMVRFLLENSLGAWWAARHPESPLIGTWEYLRRNEDGTPAAGSFDEWPERAADVTVMDPCCGSGHFLVAMFGMLWRMRAEEEGLAPAEAQDAVLRDNLHGLELDPRCSQIATFNVALEAWKQGGFRQLPAPRIACSGAPVRATQSEWEALARDDNELRKAMTRLHSLFRNADTLGSLIDPRSGLEGDALFGLDTSIGLVWQDLEVALGKAMVNDAGPNHVLGHTAEEVTSTAALLARKYHLVVTNPPYLGQLKQSEILKEYVDSALPDGRSDLAVAFLSRMRTLTSVGGAVAAVAPEEWLSASRAQRFRDAILVSSSFALLARLGYGAFSTPLRVQPLLSIVVENTPRDGHRVACADVSGSTGVLGKSEALQESDVTRPRQSDLVMQGRITLAPGSGDAPLASLADFVDVRAGQKAGDVNRFEVAFWEVPSLGGVWEYLQTAPTESLPVSGRSRLIRWEQECGSMARLADSVKHLNHVAQNWRRGKPLWGKLGVVFALMGGDLRFTLYSGEIYSSTCAAVVPRDQSLLPALWAFAQSGDWANAVRAVKTGIAVDPHDLTRIPFDIERWREMAGTIEFPSRPTSTDPRQWVFNGSVAGSSHPLQVAVCRLLGFQWPEQRPLEDLSRFVDSDGIAALQALPGEPDLSTRLRALLSAAYGVAWSSGLERQLVVEAGGKNGKLEDWLRDQFFAQHAKVFDNRPFLWHIWDGRKDGFSAIVNYHKLDRRTLEKLTFTSLGAWIERQKHEARAERAGADARLAAAEDLQRRLELILDGEPPYDVYVRWKSMAEQPIGWDPDLDDGVRLNIRPFVTAGVLRAKVNVHWKKDRGKNPDGSERHNDLHPTLDERRAARRQAEAAG